MLEVIAVYKIKKYPVDFMVDLLGIKGVLAW